MVQRKTGEFSNTTASGEEVRTFVLLRSSRVGRTLISKMHHGLSRENLYLTNHQASGRHIESAPYVDHEDFQESMTMTPKECAIELARAHRDIDPATKDVYLASGENDPLIRLVEVSASVPTTSEFFPYSFMDDPQNGVPYPSVLILVSPGEWKSLMEGKRNLPPGWPDVHVLRLNRLNLEEGD